jgi:hypothetical protein
MYTGLNILLSSFHYVVFRCCISSYQMDHISSYPIGASILYVHLAVFPGNWTNCDVSTVHTFILASWTVVLFLRYIQVLYPLLSWCQRQYSLTWPCYIYPGAVSPGILMPEAIFPDTALYHISRCCIPWYPDAGGNIPWHGPVTCIQVLYPLMSWCWGQHSLTWPCYIYPGALFPGILTPGAIFPDMALLYPGQEADRYSLHIPLSLL